MKNLLKSAICAGLTLPLLSYASVSVGPARTSTDFSEDAFHDLITAMNVDSQELFTAEGDSLSVKSPIYFNVTTQLPFNVQGDWDLTADGSAVESIEFKEVTNFEAFVFGQGGTLDIGFIGEESTHDNELGFYEGGTYTDLFSYNAGGETPPMSHTLTASAGDIIKFAHKNDTINSEGMQIQPDRFRIWEVSETPAGQNAYLFAVADRNANVDSDYDDGFFYVVGDISPIPEPSHIAVLATMGLGVLLVVRRRLIKKKA